MRCSVGPAPRWRTTTRKALIASDWRSRRQASCCRTIGAQIIPHQVSLCGKNGENVNDNNGIFSRWWAVTASNRRHPACKAGALPTELTALTARLSLSEGAAQARQIFPAFHAKTAPYGAVLMRQRQCAVSPEPSSSTAGSPEAVSAASLALASSHSIG